MTDHCLSETPLGDIKVATGANGMSITLEADQNYSLTTVQDPENYHLIVISYVNEDVNVRIDNNYYAKFSLIGDFDLRDSMSLVGDVDGEFLNL